MNRRLKRDSLARERVRLISGRLRERRKKVVEPLRRGVFLVPVTITSLGLLAGFYSLVLAVEGRFEMAALMVGAAFLCDGLDGRVARASRTSSQFGVEYDSLSDIVAFGVAPAAMVYLWALKALGAWGAMVCGLYVVAAALRLARFNVTSAAIDKRRFVGLPVPGAAILLAALVAAWSPLSVASIGTLSVVMAPLTLCLAALMISRVPYPSFKSLHLRRRAPVEIMALILVGLAFLFAMPELTIFLLTAAYVASGPYLLATGERMSAKMPMLRVVPGERPPEAADNARKPGSGGARKTSELGPGANAPVSDDRAR